MSTPVKEKDAHALCSPSGAERWMVCLGSVALEVTEPETTSEYAEEGTRAHTLAAALLQSDAPFELSADYPPEMHDFVGIYVSDIQARVDAYANSGADHVELHVEQKLSIEHITGEKGAKGTADAIILAKFPDGTCVLDVNDLKYGMGVHVSPVSNPQLKIYALAALKKFEEQFDVRQVLLRIHQPRVSEVASEWQISVAELRAFQAVVKERASIALRLLKTPDKVEDYLVPGEVQCRFCKALSKCPAAAKVVHESVFGDFQDITAEDAVPVTIETYAGSVADYSALLPKFMRRVALIEHWCKSIRAKVEEELMAQRPVEGFKLVEGRKGHRQWADAEATLALLAARGVPFERVATKPELKPPAQVEKVLAPNKKAPAADREAWLAVSELVKQADGSPSVAPIEDPRPAWSPALAHDFDTFDANDLA